MSEHLTNIIHHRISCEICILAGGRSSRMGRDKTGLRLGGVPLLQHAKRSARQLGLSARVIRHDLVPQCGPLGGVFTALTTSPAESVMFLSCDMPFLSTELLTTLLRRGRAGTKSIFVEQNQAKGFPFLLHRKALPLVGQQISRRQFSLQELAEACGAETIRLPRTQHRELFNVNTPEEWRTARELWRRLHD